MITIVTPSYNQGEFIEETILSIINQDYPNFEYFLIDGGSTDQTLDIIKKYEKYITWWVSEPDEGQSDAINKGFAKAKGEWGTWINSDDMLAEGALSKIGDMIQSANMNDILMGRYHIVDRYGRLIHRKHSTIETLEELVDIQGQWRSGNGNQIGQQGMLFPISLYKEVGGLSVDNHYSMDYELWGKMLLAGGRIIPVQHVIGIFRSYQNQKISNRKKTTESLLNDAKKLVRSTDWSFFKKWKFFLKIYRYQSRFNYHQLRSLVGVKRRLKQWLR